MWISFSHLQILAIATTVLSTGSVHSCKAWPGTPSWSSVTAWAALNATVHGRLIAVVPPAAPCHKTFENRSTYNSTVCSNLTSAWSLQPTHYQDPVSMMNDIYTNMTCLTTDKPDTPCTIGSYPNYVIKAETIADIQAGVIFAGTHNVRLVIKNTGHDFMGRSIGAGSLSIWTHQFDEMTLTNYSSPQYTGSAVRLGAGVLTGNVYDLLDKAGQVYVAGECQSVGFAGGYIQGGGHGPLSTLYGMGSDQALEFTLVTANGKHITANAKSYPDLFWALRGGGPAAWGVITSVTVKTFLTPKVAGAVIKFGSMEPDTFWSGIDAFHAETPSFVAEGMYAYYTFSTENNFLLKPLLAPGKTAAELNVLIAPLLASLDARGVNYTIEVSDYPTFHAGYRALFDGESAGGTFLTSSRLFQIDHVRNNNSAITTALRTLVDGGLFIISHMVGPGQNGGVQNAVNPAWKNGILLPLTNRVFTANTTLEFAIADQIPLDNALKAASPGSGTYLNEANIFDPDWKEAFWGSNYPRLQAIKTTYDSTGVFWAKTSVGSDMFKEVAGRLCRV